LGIWSHVTEVIVNPTFREYCSLLGRSKVFVHPKIGEHFGIAIVEAMASGCATICHRSGGPLTDIILGDERYGLLYRNKEELVRKVKYLLSDENIWRDFSRRAIEGAKRFGYERIKSKVESLIGRAFSILDMGMVRDIIRSFTKRGDIVLNPFLSWGVVAIVARELDRNSISFDVVPDYVEEARRKIRLIEQCNPKDVFTIIRCVDSREMPLGDEVVDLILGSPPYWHVERYKSVPGQLSDIETYEEFLEELSKIVSECRRVLKRGKLCVWIVGDWIEDGKVYYFHKDVIRLFRSESFVIDQQARSVTDKYTVRGERDMYLRIPIPFKKM